MREIVHLGRHMQTDPITTLTMVERDDSGRARIACLELYGPDAPAAAAICALEAHIDGREADFHFWFEVFEELHVCNGNARH